MFTQKKVEIVKSKLRYAFCLRGMRSFIIQKMLVAKDQMLLHYLKEKIKKLVNGLIIIS